MGKTKTAEGEEKLTLPYGDLEQGVHGPDLSFRDSAGELQGDEADAYDELVQTHEDEVAAAQEHEHAVATARAQEAEVAPREPAAKGKSASSSETPAAS